MVVDPSEFPPDEELAQPAPKRAPGKRRGRLNAAVNSLLGQQNTIAIPVAIVRALDGNYALAAFATQCAYWQGVKGEGRWWYHSDKEWHEEMSISPRSIRTFRKVLSKRGWIETKVWKQNGFPTMHYRWRIDRVLADLAKQLEV